jgi:hypothetical protein
MRMEFGLTTPNHYPVKFMTSHPLLLEKYGWLDERPSERKVMPCLPWRNVICFMTKSA